jgi:hypothetical protein
MQVEHERLFPGRQTYCRYLHVAEAVAEDDGTLEASWDGLGGRIKALRREVVDRVDRVEAKVDAGQAKVEADVAGVKAKLEADMEVVKGLLEKLGAQSLQSAA